MIATNRIVTSCSLCSLNAGQDILQCVGKEICITDQERSNLSFYDANWGMGAAILEGCVIVIVFKKQAIQKFTDYTLFILESPSKCSAALVGLLSFFFFLP